MTLVKIGKHENVNISIDKDNLDIEWERQSMLIDMVIQEYANVASKRFEIEEGIKNHRTRYKVNLETLSSTIEVQMRSNPSDFGIQKVTENAIGAFLNSYPDIIKLKEEFCSHQERMTKILTKLKKEEEYLDGLRRDVFDRIQKLKHLTKLYFDGYYGHAYKHGIMKNPQKEGGNSNE